MTNPIPFEHVIVDADTPPDPHIKAMGDVGGNGLADIVIPSSKGGPLVWYEAPGWQRYEIAPTGRWSCEAQVVDMDGDGDGDILISEWYNENRLEWYENPLPEGNPRQDPWKRHIIGEPRAHNIEVADLDGDGRMEITTRDQGQNGGKILVWKRADGGWRHREIPCPLGEGLNTADVDGDGRPEIVIGGRWYETPADVMVGDFAEHVFAADWPGDAMVRCADMSGRGRVDVVLARSEGVGQST
jgi:hypothetical protein